MTGLDAKALSVVIPALNEAAIITDTLARLQGLRALGAEVLLVDGGSTDATGTLADPLVDRLLASPPGRARQMNAGWRGARGALVWFVHADTVITEDHWRAVLQCGSAAGWGWFDVRLDSPRPVFGLVAALMNRRARLTRVATGDQGIFVARGLLEQIGGFPEIPLMEDVALCRRLKGRAAHPIARPRLVASARRWERHGTARTILKMWYLRAAFYLGADPAKLARSYRDAR